MLFDVFGRMQTFERHSRLKPLIERRQEDYSADLMPYVFDVERQEVRSDKRKKPFYKPLTPLAYQLVVLNCR